MAELMVLLQALLLVAGWLLFLRAQTELRAQAARQSLTGELEDLRQTLEALLTRLTAEADRAEQSIRLLQEMSLSRPAPLHPEAQGHTDTRPRKQEEWGIEQYPHAHSPFFEMQELQRDEETPRSDSEKADTGYNIFQSQHPAFSAVVQLAQEGLSIPEIARRTGYALGEVELILNLSRRHKSEE